MPYEPPRHRHFRSALEGPAEAVEFVVRTSGPIPIRALGPALFVGDVPVIECQRLEDDLYRFTVPDPARLRPGAPIGWGWNDARGDERRQTPFRYEEPR